MFFRNPVPTTADRHQMLRARLKKMKIEEMMSIALLDEIPAMFVVQDSGSQLDTLQLMKLAKTYQNVAMYILKNLHISGFEQKLGGFNSFALMHYYQNTQFSDPQGIVLHRLSGNYYADLADKHPPAKKHILNKLAHKLHPDAQKRLLASLKKEISSPSVALGLRNVFDFS
jgi:hypothetical protein